MAGVWDPSTYGSATQDLFKATKKRQSEMGQGIQQQQAQGAQAPGPQAPSGETKMGSQFGSALGKVGSALGGPAGGAVGEVLGAGLDTMMMFSAAAKKETEKRQSGLIASVGGMQSAMMRSAEHSSKLGGMLKSIG